ncbi:efflux RND transporter periplasmic adaptor subunit [Alsobacter sp. R-9]
MAEAPALGEGRENRAHGLVRSLGEATISSELSARITTMPFREGQPFRAGDLLVAFDCSRNEAEQASLEAEMAAAKATHDGNLELERHKAIGARDMIISAARLGKAAADVNAGNARLKGCRILAPFDGFVVETSANPHEIANPSTPLLRVVDASRLEIELIAPSRWLRRDLVGQTFDFTLEDTGSVHPARVIRQAAVVDAVSQTVKLFAVLLAPDPRVKPGMSGTATFSAEADGP